MKKNEPIYQEMRSLAPYFLIICGVYLAIMTVLCFFADFGYTVITGGVYGCVLNALNFWLLGLSAGKAVRKNPDQASRYMRSMYGLRFLGLFLALTAAAVLPCFNIVATVIPLVFVRIAIMIRTFREKED